MKKLLWKPSRVNLQIHILIALIAVVGMVFVETCRIEEKQPYYRTKILAAKTMKASMEVLREHRIRHVKKINLKIDHLNSGLIGKLNSPITTSTVDISNKLVTINPNWAAALVDIFKEARLKKGDVIAVSFTGSFPAINIAVLSAAKAMDLHCVIITSEASSTWGANIPGFTWLDMEKILYDKGIIPYRSSAASLGGLKDNALGLSDEGRDILKNTILGHNIKFIEFTKTLDNIDSRMAVFQENAGDRSIRAYINVGGGSVSIGTFIGKRRYKPGINLKPSYEAMRIDSVISRFAMMGIPVINMNYMNVLAKKYGLPVTFDVIPPIGRGELYSRKDYNNILIVSVLVLLMLLLYIFIKLGLGYRIFTPQSKDDNRKAPEHMV